jgi:thiamine-phosphate pyrophosphorylase
LRDLPRLLVITDRHGAAHPLEAIADALCVPGGAPWLLFRDKDLPFMERRFLATTLREMARSAGVLFSVSADVGLASGLRADGVHLQRLDQIAAARGKLGPDAAIGFSAHSVAEVFASRDAGADYVTLSPIFPTASKSGYGPALGLDAIRDAAKAGIPVFALGGVLPENAASCREAGAYGVAVMGSVMRAQDPFAAVQAYL